MAVTFLNPGFTFTFSGGDPNVSLVDDAGGPPFFAVTNENWSSQPNSTTGHMTVSAWGASPAFAGASYSVSSPPLTLLDVASTSFYSDVHTVVGRGDGGVAVLIDHDTDATNGDLTVQFVTGDGALGPSFSLPQTATKAYFGSGLARLDDGRFLLTYSEKTLTAGVMTDVELYTQMLDANGAALGAPVAVTADPAGVNGGGELIAAGSGFVQIYKHADLVGGVPSGWSLRAQRFNASGAALGAPTIVSTSADGDESFHAVAKSLATGGCIVFWKEETPAWDEVGDDSLPAPAGFTESWTVRYAMLDAAGAVVSSGQLESGSRTSDGTNWSGAPSPVLEAVDLANGGAALSVSNYSATTGFAKHLYTFDRNGLVGADLAANLPAFADLAPAADGATLVLIPSYNSTTATNQIIGNFVSIAPRGVVGDATGETLYGDAVVNDIISGGGGNDVLFGLSGDDALSGGDGDDRLIGGAGADALQGDAGFDTADYAAAPGGVTVNLSVAGPQNTVSTGTDTLSSIENIVGSLGADTLTGDAVANVIKGGAGNDRLDGGAGADTLSGEDGNDILIGGVGNDTMLGGAGNDSLFAGDGFNYGYGGDGDDVLVGGKDFNVLVGDAGNDYMYLYNAGGQAYGGAGDDVAVGNNANDVFVMGEGDDVAYGYGANDYFYMGAGNDVMYGGDGVDVLLGEAGADYFDGGTGIDYLFLGANDHAVDMVFLNTASGIDVVNDFEAGTDVLRLVGTKFQSMSDVLAATSDYGSFSIITVDAQTAVWLIGVTPAQIAASSVALG
jgi:Ca2+-binding RTX toxin-like protein